ncbi:uncharacterized protein LOC130137093 isoform X1 [Syzygium oleosum]|uniref:uncharacterized protein LOC130137093 isoform X1 n=1 Tax=Syzygium oleosum TaxID=219896 RepID=UPI0024BB6D71|nr:uncharacterized protein LOC130137093 isoform X1 [Syzygium oleosum]
MVTLEEAKGLAVLTCPGRQEVCGHCLEHDICFSMPLCHSKVEQLATEDLVELSETEKHNLGQTRISDKVQRKVAREIKTEVLTRITSMRPLRGRVVTWNE